ncbi:MAG: iron ABC transporter permease [Desulfobacterales bacterium]|nr:iron ABC transporter permease [Desulfobacterales bacterium]
MAQKSYQSHSFWGIFGRFQLLSWTMLVVVAIGVMAPLLLLLVGGFSSARLPSEMFQAGFTLDNYAAIYLDPFTYGLILNTLIYAGGSVLMGMSLSLILAYLVARTDLPYKGFFYAGILCTLAVPGMLQAMAWVMIFSPRMGMVNQFWTRVLGFDGPLFNIYSLAGMVFVEGLRLVPTSFLMLVPLMRSMDPALEEAATVAGARPKSRLRRVTLPLLAPGILAMTIYQAMTALEVFEVPGILGLPANIYVLSTKLYTIVRTPVNVPIYGQANALAMIFLALAGVTVYLYERMTRRGERFAVITGKGYRPREQRLGYWRYPGMALGAVYIFLASVLPFLVFIYTSFIPYLQVPSAKAFRNLTLKNYVFLYTYSTVPRTLINTVIMVVVVATAVTVLSFLISYVIVRTKFRWRRVLDQLAFVPHAIPGVIMGLAFFWIFANLHSVNLYGTIWSICIGFTVRFLSYGTRSMNSAFLQVHKELEEAAFVSGARLHRTLKRVFLPLMLPVVTGLWTWVILHAVRIAGVPLMLYQGQDNQVLAVLIWNMWDQGYVPSVAALGTILMAVLFLVTIWSRKVGFRRLGVKK